MKKLCACGCGGEIIYKRHHSWKPARYISGHNSKNTGKGYSLNNGYKRITRRGKNEGKYQHVLVMEEHIGRKLADKEVVHHINGNKLDNRLENLELKTISDHIKLHFKDGNMHVLPPLYGEDNPRSKLTEKKVLEIRKNKTDTSTVLAKKYNVCRSTIKAVRNRKVWKQI